MKELSIDQQKKLSGGGDYVCPCPLYVNNGKAVICNTHFSTKIGLYIHVIICH